MIDSPLQQQKTGEVVQVVVTFAKDGKVGIYRNGETYSNEYDGKNVMWAMDDTSTRIVFGHRASKFQDIRLLPEAINNGTFATDVSKRNFPDGSPRTDYPGTDIAGIEEANIGVLDSEGELSIEGSHSAFFHGTILRASLIKGTLLAEEVRGLYQVKLGTGRELGCHCYQACPVGSNKFFPSVPIPCSGQGACLRSLSGEPFKPGKCECLPGYSGNACQFHCSEISEVGCCTVDDDCPYSETGTQLYCNLETHGCEVVYTQLR